MISPQVKARRNINCPADFLFLAASLCMESARTAKRIHIDSPAARLVIAEHVKRARANNHRGLLARRYGA
ncbi:MAG TPA: hypothetical protein VFQ54_02145 [Thermomicrobiales bacterium]|nr:hypothetical protein [Thermomicrobiales bacterium]